MPYWAATLRAFSRSPLTSATGLQYLLLPMAGRISPRLRRPSPTTAKPVRCAWFSKGPGIFSGCSVAAWSGENCTSSCWLGLGWADSCACAGGVRPAAATTLEAPRRKLRRLYSESMRRWDARPAWGGCPIPVAQEIDYSSIFRSMVKSFLLSKELMDLVLLFLPSALAQSW